MFCILFRYKYSDEANERVQYIEQVGAANKQQGITCREIKYNHDGTKLFGALCSRDVVSYDLEGFRVDRTYTGVTE
jgi:hypothetical protein